MKILRYYSLSCLVALMLGCAPRIHVHTEYDSAINLQQYRTFKWYSERPEAEPDGRHQARYDTFLDRNIKSILEQELTAKGYQKVERDADMLIAFEFSLDRQQRMVDPGGPMWMPGMFPGHPWGWRYGMGYRWHYGFDTMWARPMVREFQEKAVIIDVVDRNRNQLVWRGTGETEVAGRQISENRIREVVAQILDSFPVAPDVPAAKQ
jgi:hypothetical protein